MPRYPSQTSLPPLKEVFPQFEALQTDRPKVEQVTEMLKQIVSDNRTTHNLIFYSTRDIARFFQISQNTAAFAVQRLEMDGLLCRIRGSHTVMLGYHIITRSRIRAVVGLMSWVFALRFSETQGALTRLLAEELWPHQIALDIIPHYDLGDHRPDLDETLKKHLVDFVVWPFPFAHHKEHILYLQDRGIRSLVIGVEGIRSPFKPDILVDFQSSYEEILQFWKKDLGIRKVIAVTPREFTPRKRIKLFATIAQRMGFDCSIETSSYTLPAEILEREKKGKVGIALLDEHSLVEFTFYAPPIFEELARRHRILFGNGAIKVPFVPNGELRVDRIFIPMMPTEPRYTKPLIPAISKILTRWCCGDFTAKPAEVHSHVWTNSELWRYL